MAQQIEKKLDNLIHEIKSIRSELIMKDATTRKQVIRKIRSASWEALGVKVSSAWDSVSAIDEISLQRDKTW